MRWVIPPSLLDLPWLISLPLVSNLALELSSLLLVVFLGKFTLPGRGHKPLRWGLWLAGLLMKPQMLILLLRGLLLCKKRCELAGFGLGAAEVEGLSLLLGGIQGLLGSLKLIVQFSDPLIQTAPMMMNERDLALNLAQVIPLMVAWAIALGGMLMVSA